MWKAIVVSMIILAAVVLLSYRHVGFDRAGAAFAVIEKERRLTIAGSQAPFYIRALIADRGNTSKSCNK